MASTSDGATLESLCPGAPAQVCQRLAFEELLTELSASFIHLSGNEVDGAVQAGLARIVSFLGVDRGTLLEYHQESDTLTMSYVAGPDLAEGLSDSDFVKDAPSYTSRMKQGSVVHASSTAQMRQEVGTDADASIAGGTRSHISIPLRVADRFLGAIAFADLTNERPWPDSLIRQLRIVGEVFASALQRKRQDQEIERYKVNLQKLAAQLTRVEEAERNRIAVGLHDHAAQNLALVKMRLGMLAKQATSEEAREQLEQVRSQILDTANQLRELSFELSPPILSKSGLEAALDLLARNFQRDYGIACHFDDDGVAKQIGQSQRALLYRCATEALANVQKHAGASLVRISTRRTDAELVLAIEDNGSGFDASSAINLESAAGFGLFSIRERLQAEGGRLELSSKVGSGSTLTMYMPMDAPAREGGEVA